MFIPNNITNQVYRYTITPDHDPVLTASIPVNLATGVAASPSGELFIGEYSSTGTLSRFLSPLGSPVANGTISGVGIHFPEQFTFVDDELWVPNTAAYSCGTEPESLVRLGFDAQGAASVAGTIQAGQVSANRGILWLPATRDLYVTQCIGVDAIQHYHVALDHTVTLLPPITGHGLNNPHGMAMTAWGELLVVNVSAPDVLRLQVDNQGSATVRGSIVGNGMSWPVGVALAPWGEMFVVSQGNGLISRFTFDSSHVAIPNGIEPGDAHVTQRLRLQRGVADFDIVRPSPTLVAEAARKLGFPTNFHFHTPSVTDPPTFAALRRFVRALAAGNDSLEIECACTDAVHSVLSRLGEAPRLSAHTLDPIRDYRLRRLRDHLRAHLDKRPTLTELATVAELCQWRLCVIFKRAYGISIGQYWNALRLAEAVQRLQRGTPIKMIVAALGYADEPYFWRVFKAHYGMAPGGWLSLYRANDRLSAR